MIMKNTPNIPRKQKHRGETLEVRTAKLENVNFNEPEFTNEILDDLKSPGGIFDDRGKKAKAINPEDKVEHE